MSPLQEPEEPQEPRQQGVFKVSVGERMTFGWAFNQSAGRAWDQIAALLILWVPIITVMGVSVDDLPPIVRSTAHDGRAEAAWVPTLIRRPRWAIRVIDSRRA